MYNSQDVHGYILIQVTEKINGGEGTAFPYRRIAINKCRRIEKEKITIRTLY